MKHAFFFIRESVGICVGFGFSQVLSPSERILSCRALVSLTFHLFYAAIPDSSLL